MTFRSVLASLMTHGGRGVGSESTPTVTLPTVIVTVNGKKATSRSARQRDSGLSKPFATPVCWP
jgi:hypothetical protein